MSALSSEDLARHETEMRRHFARNYLAHGLEGGIFMGGLRFVEPQVILPAMLHTLGGPTWLVAFSPIVFQVGFFGPQIFTAFLIERLHRFHPFLMITGIPQRLSFLLAAVVLMIWGGSHPRIALLAVALAPCISSVSGGISSVGWQEFLAKTIPSERRASLWGFRAVVAAVIGLFAGRVVDMVLQAWPGPFGYGVLHLCAFGCLVVSYVIFAMIRETPLPPKRAAHERVGWWSYMRELPGIVRSDPRLRNVLLARLFSVGLLIVLPFMAVHALDALGKPDSFLGMLVIAQMVGSILGNLTGGYLGDRHSSRLVLVLARLSAIALCLGMLVASAAWHFLGLFVLFGAAFAWSRMGQTTLALEIAPLQKRVAYMTVVNLVGVAASLGAAGVASVVRAQSPDMAALAVPGAAMLAVSLFFVLRIADPRRNPPREV